MTGFSSDLNTQAPLLGSLRTYLRSDLIPLPYAYVSARAAGLEPRALPTKIDNPWPRTHINVYESNAVGKLRNQHSPRQATDKMAVCES